MSQNGELMAKIGHLAGQINLHKNHQSSPNAQQLICPQSTSYVTTDTSGIIPSDKTVQPFPTPPVIPPGYPPKPQWHRRAHGSQFYSRGASTRPSHAAHRNRTLILNTTDNTGYKLEDPNIAQGSSTLNPTANNKSEFSGPWIARRDRHIQIINPLIYEKETQARSRALEETRKLKLRKRDEREKAKVNRYLHRLQLQPGFKNASSSSTPEMMPAFHSLIVQGVRFQVTNGGSKLVKLAGDSSAAHATPKKTTIGGVLFLRSKNGNLYRSGIIKAKQRLNAFKKIPKLCKRYTSTGFCLKGPACPFIHDPNKVAICKSFLKNGVCAIGGPPQCDLSHNPSPQRVPGCVHFLRGNCVKPGCRYAHVKVSPSADICRSFAQLGFCESGANCIERHVYECPDYAKTSVCVNKKCSLPHIDRAGSKQTSNAIQVTKFASDKEPANSQNGSDSDISSEDEDYDEIDSEDIDSDDLDEEVAQKADSMDDQNFPSQQDYIQLSGFN